MQPKCISYTFIVDLDSIRTLLKSSIVKGDHMSKAKMEKIYWFCQHMDRFVSLGPFLAHLNQEKSLSHNTVVTFLLLLCKIVFFLSFYFLPK